MHWLHHPPFFSPFFAAAALWPPAPLARPAQPSPHLLCHLTTTPTPPLWPFPAPQALAAAEAVSGSQRLRVALVLLLTAHAYSRTGRVTLSEGLYREAAKMLELSPGHTGGVGGQAVDGERQTFGVAGGGRQKGWWD